MKDNFAGVYWLGGITCSGKTTTAKHLAYAFGLETYHTDAYFTAHLAKARPIGQPTMWAFAQTKGWANKVRRLPADVRVEIWRRFYRERFDFVRADLAARGHTRVLVEGVELFPDYVLPQAATDRAAWLVPTPAFFAQHYFNRPWSSAGPFAVSWPYYRGLAQVVRTQAAEHGALLIEVDGHLDTAELGARLSRHFGLA